jgi:hypothetical protein
MLSRSELLLDPDQNPNPIPLQFRPPHILHTQSAKRLPTPLQIKVHGNVGARTGHEDSVYVHTYILFL